MVASLGDQVIDADVVVVGAGGAGVSAANQSKNSAFAPAGDSSTIAASSMHTNRYALYFMHFLLISTIFPILRRICPHHKFHPPI